MKKRIRLIKIVMYASCVMLAFILICERKRKDVQILNVYLNLYKKKRNSRITCILNQNHMHVTL